MEKLIINANREGYGTDQVRRTMTVGELAELLAYYAQEYGEDTPVYIGNDRKEYGWYTYGGIREGDVKMREAEDEED